MEANYRVQCLEVYDENSGWEEWKIEAAAETLDEAQQKRDELIASGKYAEIKIEMWDGSEWVEVE